uniref:3 beta-hydroxysteroid dehydrogenase type n=1 Tax=Daphnia magna TaxID=35525 RepID=A0A0P5RFW1_9CRUS
MGSEVVLVTGGQGFLGQHIIRLLQQDPKVAEIRVIDKKMFTNRIGFEEKKVVKSFVADISKPETMGNEIFDGVNCVIHTAAETGFSHFPSAKIMEEVNVNGTRHVIHKCITANVGCLIFTSTTHVVIPKKDPLFLATEHLAKAPPKDGFLFGHYGRTKHDAENLIRDANGKRLADGSGNLATLCLRPTLLYGELDPYYVTHALKIAKDHGGCLYRIGWGGERIQVTYAGNAAWAHILAKDQLMKEPTIVGGEVIFVTDDTVIQNAFEFLDPFLKARSMKASTFVYPATLAVIFVLFLYFVSRMLRPLVHLKNPFPHPSTLYFIVCFYCFNRLKATLRLGYKPIYSPEEAINKSLDYYKNVPLS